MKHKNDGIEDDFSKNILREPTIAYLSSNSYGYNSTYSGSNASKHPVALLGLSFAKEYNEVQSDFDYIALIREGLPKNALDNIVNIAGLSITEVAQIIHTSDRTLRRYTSKQKLDAEQSERVLELARLYSRGEEVFGNMELFKSWMSREVMVLGDKKPKTFLDTSLGIEMLMDELGRIEQGVFA